MSKFVPVRRRHNFAPPPRHNPAIKLPGVEEAREEYYKKVDEAYIAEVLRAMSGMEERLKELGVCVKRRQNEFDSLLASPSTGNGVYVMTFIEWPSCNSDGRLAILRSAKAELSAHLATEGLMIKQGLIHKGGNPETDHSRLVFTVADIVEVASLFHGFNSAKRQQMRDQAEKLTEDVVLSDTGLMQQAGWADGDWPFWLKVYGNQFFSVQNFPKARSELKSFLRMYIGQISEEVGVVPVHTSLLDNGIILHAYTHKSMAVNKSRVCKSDLLFTYAKANGSLDPIGAEVPEIMTDAARQVIQGLRMSPRGHSQTYGGLVKHLEASGVNIGWMPEYATSEIESKCSIPKGAEADLIWRAMASCITDPANSPLEPLEDLIESYKRAAHRLRSKPATQ